MAIARGGEIVGALESLGQLAVVLACIWIFIKFCGFAKKFTLPGKVKLGAYILTGLGVFVMNFVFSTAKTGQGTAAVLTNPTVMNGAVAVSLVIVLIFSFALMAETK